MGARISKGRDAWQIVSEPTETRMKTGATTPGHKGSRLEILRGNCKRKFEFGIGSDVDENAILSVTAARRGASRAAVALHTCIYKLHPRGM